MKLSYYLLVLSVALAAVSCGTGGALRADQTTVELGNLTDNESVFPALKVYNKSSEPVEVDSILSSTGMVSFLGKCPLTINAGDTAFLEFSVQTDFMDGDFATLVQVYSKGSKKPLEMIVKGNVKATPRDAAELCIYPFCDAMINKREVKFGDVPVGKKVSDTIMVYNPTQSIISLFPMGMPSGISTQVIDRRIRGGNVSYIVVSFQCNDVTRLGLNLEMIKFDMGGKRNCTDNSILVQANLIESFDHLTKEQLANAPIAKVDNLEHNFGKVKLGELYTHDFKITNDGNTPLVIRAVNTTCGCTIARLSKKVVAPGETITISATFDTKGREGAQQKSIDVITNAPNSPYIKLWILADIEK